MDIESHELDTYQGLNKVVTSCFNSYIADRDYQKYKDCISDNKQGEEEVTVKRCLNHWYKNKRKVDKTIKCES